MKEKLKIGVVTPTVFTVPPMRDGKLIYGGIEILVWNLIEALNDKGHEVVLVAPKGSKSPRIGQLVETVEAEGNFDAERTAFDLYQDNKELLECDVIVGHNWAGFEYRLKERHDHLKVMHVHHGHCTWKSMPPFSRPNLTGISHFMAKELMDRFAIPVRHAYNGVDLDAYPYKEKRGERYLYLGRMATYKQPHVAVWLARKFGFGLDIVGGEFVENPGYVQYIKDQCDGEQIKFHGEVSHEEKVKFLQDCYALIFPSAMGEPFGLVAIEAFACGKPVLALSDGAIPEVVSDGMTGYVCNNMYEMERIIKEDLLIEIRAQDCLQRAQFFSKENCAERYLELFSDILDGKEW